jgi:hypothetical protein
MPKLRNQFQTKFKALKPTSTEDTDNSAVVGMKLQIASHLMRWRRPPRLGHRCVQKIITSYRKELFMNIIAKLKFQVQNSHVILKKTVNTLPTLTK